ncbi:MAG TPA: RelA/SpoT domain-containing protein [Candidatus Sulfotelmatobacter sp.]|nr:RelA/SpoT domain-containing protein [Candidatus Sulfotelmatobacter sp.]
MAQQPHLPGLPQAVEVPSVPTKSQVNRAGRTLRHFLRGQQVSQESVDQAMALVRNYRAAHQYPLIKANMGLRSVVQTEHCPVEVSQRLKRMNTILDKLRREPTMALGNMQDIGGCRAVIPSIGQLRRVEHRLKKNRPPVGYDDYIDKPRASGYRGVHIVVDYADKFGERRAIEVQLRTPLMHQWAITVERLSGRLQTDLKSGVGPAQVIEWLGAISEAMAMDERGQTVPDALMERVGNLRMAALPYLEGSQWSNQSSIS